MSTIQYATADYDHAHVPPATPPVIAPNADPGEAASLPDVEGDSDQPGSRQSEKGGAGSSASGNGGGGDTINPGQTPPEVAPDQGDTDNPGAPDEVVPDGGDSIEPGQVPDETVPPQPDVLPPPD